MLALLDALGDLDFTLAREERYAPHFAQVHPNRVVALRVVAVELFLALGRPLRLVLALARDFLLRLLLCDALRRNLDLGSGVDDLDVFVSQDAQNIVHLVGRHHVGGERVVDLVVGQEALGLPYLNELLNFLPVTVLRRHRYLGASAHSTRRPSRTAPCPLTYGPGPDVPARACPRASPAPIRPPSHRPLAAVPGQTRAPLVTRCFLAAS